MLGIGFIIAHFVAMQKPQQRKYHSSCNRSVHRGTAHGKQEVKVCKRKTPHLLMRSFFVPLRGWYGVDFMAKAKKNVFAPLRGWYGLCMAGCDSFSVFAPLRGWYCRVQPEVPRHCVFVPLRGWYCISIRYDRLKRVFAPLRGWYKEIHHG